MTFWAVCYVSASAPSGVVKIHTAFVLSSTATRDDGRLTRQFLNVTRATSTWFEGLREDGAMKAASLSRRQRAPFPRPHKVPVTYCLEKARRRTEVSRLQLSQGWAARLIVHGYATRARRVSKNALSGNRAHLDDFPPTFNNSPDSHSLDASLKDFKHHIEVSASDSTDSRSFNTTCADMATLRQYHAPVNYDEQFKAIVDFLQTFKSSQSSSAETAADAIEDLNIDEDGISDEYDFMDDAEISEGRPRRRRGGDKQKYMALLQEVADRTKPSVMIELDDLNVVCFQLPKVDINHQL